MLFGLTGGVGMLADIFQWLLLFDYIQPPQRLPLQKLLTCLRNSTFFPFSSLNVRCTIYVPFMCCVHRAGPAVCGPFADIKTLNWGDMVLLFYWEVRLV